MANSLNSSSTGKNRWGVIALVFMAMVVIVGPQMLPSGSGHEHVVLVGP